MIEKSVVATLVDEWLKDKEYFLVDLSVTKDNKIMIEIDHLDGVWLEDCADLSHYIEERLNREDEDFELEVGSAGLGKPFKVPQQYVNHIGKPVEVNDANGKIHRGTLKSTDGERFVVTCGEKVQEEGKKRPEIKDVDHEFRIDEVRYTKYIIKF